MEETDKTTAIVTRRETRLLSAEQFHQLADVPAAMVWLANIDKKNIRRAYRNDVEAFVAFCGMEHPQRKANSLSQ